MTRVMCQGDCEMMWKTRVMCQDDCEVMLMVL